MEHGLRGPRCTVWTPTSVLVPVFVGKIRASTDVCAQKVYNGPRRPFSRDLADLLPGPNTKGVLSGAVDAVRHFPDPRACPGSARQAACAIAAAHPRASPTGVVICSSLTRVHPGLGVPKTMFYCRSRAQPIKWICSNWETDDPDVPFLGGPRMPRRPKLCRRGPT